MRPHRIQAPPAVRRWRLLFVAAVLVQLVVVYAPSAPSAGELHGIDKVVHAGVFAAPVVAGLMAGLRPRWVVLLLALHAPLSELAQHVALPHRDGDIGDALADLLGVALGTAAFLLWRRRTSPPSTGPNTPAGSGRALVRRWP